jgi:DNA polymerase-3 subunit delta'
MLFQEIPGLDDIKKTLVQSVKQGHIHHAQLFLGNEGSGNLAMALAYATYVNCEDKQEHDSCGRCFSCIKFNKLIHPDFHHVLPVATTKKITSNPLSEHFLPEWRAFTKENPYGGLSDWLTFIGTENKQAQISAEESRQIIQKLSLKAFEAEYKVLLIWLPEMMNITSANAILKILEEPPVKTLFLLVSQNVDRMLTTILSRTQLVKIRLFSDNEVVQTLVEKMSLDPKRASQIAYLCEGSLNEAFRLSNEVKNDNHQLFRDWMRLCFRASLTELVEWSERFAKMGKDAQKNLLQYGLVMIREALVWGLGQPELVRLEGDERTFVEGFSKVMSPQKAEVLYSQLNDACFHLERNANAKIVFLDTSLSVAGVIKS